MNINTTFFNNTAKQTTSSCLEKYSSYTQKVVKGLKDLDYLDSLPQEVFLWILSFLNTKELAKTRFLSKKINQLTISNSQLWQEVILRDSKITKLSIEETLDKMISTKSPVWMVEVACETYWRSISDGLPKKKRVLTKGETGQWILSQKIPEILHKAVIVDWSIDELEKLLKMLTEQIKSVISKFNVKDSDLEGSNNLYSSSIINYFVCKENNIDNTKKFIEILSPYEIKDKLSLSFVLDEAFRSNWSIKDIKGLITIITTYGMEEGCCFNFQDVVQWMIHLFNYTFSDIEDLVTFLSDYGFILTLNQEFNLGWMLQITMDPKTHCSFSSALDKKKSPKNKWEPEETIKLAYFLMKYSVKGLNPEEVFNILCTSTEQNWTVQDIKKLIDFAISNGLIQKN